MTGGTPCPPWCRSSHQDDWDDGTVGRMHHADVELTFTYPEVGEWTCSVVLVQNDEALTRDGPALHTWPAEIRIEPALDGLSGPQARQLAAALLDAADAWDRAAPAR
jgi:hypothetical protein